MNDSESTQVQYASFLVRLWCSCPSAPEGYDAGWQGEIEHIQSGRRWWLGSLADLTELLDQLVVAGTALPELAWRSIP